MESLGTELRAHREKLKVRLSEIADETRISLRYLQDLEEGRIKNLPGGIYNRAFLRAYCEFLGLDAQHYLRRYEEEAGSPADKPPRSKPRSFKPPKLGKAVPSILPWTLMLLVSITGLYLSRRWIATFFSPYFQTPAGKPTPQQSSYSIQPMPPPTEPPAQVSSPSAEDSSPAETQEPSVGDTLQEGDTPEALPTSKIRLEFQVIDTCWVSVNGDGKSVLVKLLEPGDDQSFEAAERFYVILGNAGGIRVRLNGISAKPLGKPGEVVRVLINENNIEDFLDPIDSR